MKPSQDDLDKWLKGAGEVPFPKHLEERIVAEAEAMLRDGETGQLQGSKRYRKAVRNRVIRAWLVGVGGVAAAVLVSLAVWNTGMPHKTGVNNTLSTSEGSSPAAGQAKAGPANQVGQFNALKQVSTGNTIGLRAAPVQITNLSLASSKPGGPRDEVVATLTNAGTTPVSRQDLFGVLSFHSGSGTSSILQSVDWITFVNAPNQTIMPGQSVTWSFQPATAPTDKQKNLIDKPALQFYWDGTVSPAQATDNWNVAPLEVNVTGVTVRNTWATTEAFAVSTTVKNTTNKPIPWSSLLAVVWFDSPGSGSTTPAVNSTSAGGTTVTANSTSAAGTTASGTTPQGPGFTQPGVSRYLSKVSGPAGKGKDLNPGQTADLTFDLVGALNPNLTSLTPHVLFIQPGGSQP